MVTSKLFIKRVIVLAAAFILFQSRASIFNNWIAPHDSEFVTDARVLNYLNQAQAAGFLSNSSNLASLEQSSIITNPVRSKTQIPGGDSEPYPEISVLTTTLPFFNYLPVILVDGNIVSSPPNLEAPVLLAPADGSPQARPEFEWTDVMGATAYHFQLSATNTFASLVVNETVITSTFSMSSTVDGLYYWRVYALNNSIIGPYSQVRSVQLVNYNGDADGDSLPNGWELHGYDKDNDNPIEVNLPTLGANYLHKDIFVEMDYMERASATNGIAPSQTVIDRIIAVYANAPVSNPDGLNGIKLHLELDDLVPYDDNLSWDNGQLNEFWTLKRNYFDSSKRAAIYHYMVWANKYAGRSTETPLATGYSLQVPGADFFVTLGFFNSGAGATDNQKVSVFVHELGHNLGLWHGGSDLYNYKPNYFSVMNYWWDLTGMRYNNNYIIDYQSFDLPTLNETLLNEMIGLNGGALLAGYHTSYYCPNGSTRTVPADGPVDWNCDGDTKDSRVRVDINKDGSFTELTSSNDWSRIVFQGNDTIGAR